MVFGVECSRFYIPGLYIVLELLLMFIYENVCLQSFTVVSFCIFLCIEVLVEVFTNHVFIYNIAIIRFSIVLS